MAENISRVNLFEGIIIGIYGNWLISFVDSIAFTKSLYFFGHELWFYQPVCMIFSFVCLILLIAIGIFRAELLTRGLVVILAIGHFVGMWASLYVEGFTFKNSFFLGIGGFLFLLIYSCELWRVREIQRSGTRQQ